MRNPSTYQRLRDLANGHRGSAAAVSVSRGDAIALGLEVGDGQALVEIPASQLVAAADQLANPEHVVVAESPASDDGEPDAPEADDKKPAAGKKSKAKS